MSRGFGLLSALFAVVGTIDVVTGRPLVPTKDDRRSDLAGLRTLLALGNGSGLTFSERAEAQGQLDRLVSDDGAELDERRRAKLALWLRNVGLAS